MKIPNFKGRLLGHITSISGALLSLMFTKSDPWPVFLPVTLFVAVILIIILSITELYIFLKPILYWKIKRSLMLRNPDYHL